MKGYCCNCKKYMQGKKKAFSLGWFIFGFGIFYILYRALFVFRNRCQICGLKLSRNKSKCQ